MLNSVLGRARASGFRRCLLLLASSGRAVVLTTPGTSARGTTMVFWGALRLAVLGGLLYEIDVTPPGLGLRGQLLIVTVCVALAAAGWLGWLTATFSARSGLTLATSLAVLVISSCVAAGIAPAAPVQALGGLGIFAAALTMPTGSSVFTLCAGLAALAAASVASGHALGSAGGYAVLLAGIALGGLNRRQYVLRGHQAESLIRQTRQTQVEQARAAALTERARIAREVHDVLAHSLSALAVQLDAADALLAVGQSPGRAQEHVKRARGLAVEGMSETRRAIAALRGETFPLHEQLDRLSRDYQADAGARVMFQVAGTPRRLPADAELTAFRTAQEALTNARKHAPNASVRIVLSYLPDAVSLEVIDRVPGGNPTGSMSRPASAIAGEGGGFGLAGLAERAALAGGTFDAGPADDGWAVRLWLPQ